MSNGTNTIVIGGQPNSNFAAPVTDAAWSPDGSRVAFVDNQGQIVTERADGSRLDVVAPAKAGVTRSHPTWFAGGTAVVFTQTQGGTSNVVAVPAHTPSGQTPQVSDPLSHLVSQMTEGTESSPDSNGGSLVFQHVDLVTHTDQVWIQDGFGRGSGGPVLVGSGDAPVISPDGSKIAYLQGDSSGDQQIWVVGWDHQNAKTTGAPVQLTTDAHTHRALTWSPDGTRIAFENFAHAGASAIDVESIAAAGGGQRPESATPGVPAYQPRNKDTVTRLAGGDRIGTALDASQAQWFTPGTGGQYAPHAASVVLARYDNFADALGGSTLAEQKYGPLLLTPTDHLDAGVKAEISRVLGPVNAQVPQTVYVLGGTAALSPAVFDAVKTLGYNVQRVFGPDRYATSVAIAHAVTTDFGTEQAPTRIMVATGNNAPDALSAAPAAIAYGGSGYRSGVVVLTNDKTMPASTAAYLAQYETGTNKPEVDGVGGQADAALASVGVAHTAIVGQDRYQTSYLVAKTFFSGWDYGATPPSTVGFATGLTWPDALAGGAFMGVNRGPLILVNPATGEPSPDAQAWLSGWSPSISSAYVFGGTAAVADSTLSNVAGLIDGPAGFNLANNPKA